VEYESLVKANCVTERILIKQGNLRNLHSHKYSGLANAKTIDIQDSPTGITITSRKSKASPYAIASARASQNIRARSGGRRALGVTANVFKKGYRPDLLPVSLVLTRSFPCPISLLFLPFPNIQYGRTLVRTRWILMKVGRGHVCKIDPSTIWTDQILRSIHHVAIGSRSMLFAVLTDSLVLTSDFTFTLLLSSFSSNMTLTLCFVFLGCTRQDVCSPCCSDREEASTTEKGPGQEDSDQRRASVVENLILSSLCWCLCMCILQHVTCVCYRRLKLKLDHRSYGGSLEVL